MKKLKVNCRGKLIFEISLDPSRQYTAGRKEGCEIPLENEKLISREHFKLAHEQGSWVVELLSRYGDLVYKGEETKQIKLLEEDTFLVPPFEFIISNQIEKELSESSLGGSSRGSRSPELEDLSFEKTSVRNVEYTSYIRSIEPKSGRRYLTQLGAGNTWIAGRDSGCSIHIRDSRVSRRQFEIHHIGINYYILDLGSVNGTLLNGTAVSSSEPILLKSGDLIAVLDNHFYFELHDSEFQKQLESVQQLPAVMNPIDVPQVNNFDNTQGNEIVNYDPTQIDHFEEESEENSETHNNEEAAAPSSHWKSKKFFFVLAAVVLVLAYLLSEKPTPSTPSQPLKDGLGQLSTAQKAKLQQTYNLAKNLYIQQKYQLAATELDKVSDLSKDLPEFNELRQFVNEAMVLNDQLRKKETEEQNRREIEEKILTQITYCKKLINPKVTEQIIDDCLNNVLALGPDHPGISELKQKAAEIESRRQLQSSQKANYQAAVRRFQKLYAQAETTAKAGNPLASIDAYERVLASSLPDPGRLKALAKQKIFNIRREMDYKIKRAIVTSEKFFGNHEYKKAILTLRGAQRISPNNVDMQDKIAKYIGELRKDMMIIYQEGVLEESFGNVEGGENRPGAKEKWKKILELDVSDGEYYRKAQMKLKKYGGF